MAAETRQLQKRRKKDQKRGKETISMYESITAYIPGLSEGKYGGWSERQGDGTPENPYELCHIEYSETVRGLIDDLFKFRRKHKDLDFFLPGIMEEIESKNKVKELTEIDVSTLDSRLIIGLLLYIISMERFSDGLFLNCCESGLVLRCLQQLKKIDDSER